MKVRKFLLIIFFIFTINIQNLLSEEDKMIKGLEIFNEVAGCAAPGGAGGVTPASSSSSAAQSVASGSLKGNDSNSGSLLS